MKSLTIELEEKRMHELELMAKKLKLPLADFAKILLSSISLSDIKVGEEDQAKVTGIPDEKFQELKSRVLEKYNSTEPEIKIEDLPDNALFETTSGRQFVKGDKQRTRYKCRCLNNNKLYLFHPLTPIIPVSR